MRSILKWTSCVAVTTAVLIGGFASAAFATNDPPGGSWDMIVHTADGGATVYAEIDDASGQAAWLDVCDTKSDGHHAYGEISWSIDSGAHWNVFGQLSDYNGLGSCVERLFTPTVAANVLVRVRAWNMEGSSVVSGPATSNIWKGWL